jgi:hypothetical protein
MERLWAERHLLEFLEFKLVAAKLLLTADVRRFVGPALDEVEHVIEQVRMAEIKRGMVVARVAQEWQVPVERITLTYLVERAPEPAALIFAEHRAAFMKLTTEIEDLAIQNRLMAQATLAHIREAMAVLVGTEPGTTSRVTARPVRVGDGQIVNVTQRGGEVAGRTPGQDGLTMLETLASQVRVGGPSTAGSIEDLDVADATMEMQLQEVAYQSTLAAMDRALQSSLADFLR